METKIDELKAVQGELADLRHAIATLSWDQQVNMPPGGAEARGSALAALNKLFHARATDPAVGRLLEAAEREAAELDPDSDEARLVKVTRRRFDKQVKVPAWYVVENAQTRTRAMQAWRQARAEDDFAKFRPHLEKTFELRRKYVEFFAPYGHIYDPLLDDYEPGLKTADVQAIFARLRQEQTRLIREIAARGEAEAAFLELSYDRQKQWDFGVEIITRFGYDWQRGRQDYSAHPFTQGLSQGDVRITTRITPNNLGQGLFATLHECGHALYDLGVDPRFNRTMLDNGASLAVHESQSRLWENLVGRSRAFWEGWFPRLQAIFPEQLGAVDAARFYRAVNRVRPSLIRVEADEATYNLHIMLRLELEIALLEGSLEPKDLPAAWNERFQEYLGIAPESDANGALQDIHWSMGLVGYFATYALGNLVSVQLWERARQDLPGLDERIRAREYGELLGWLRARIHRHGAKYEPQELVERATGSKIDPEPYLRYLRAKYLEAD